MKNSLRWERGGWQITAASQSALLRSPPGKLARSRHAAARLCHSVPQGPPQRHTRTRSGDREDPAFCKRSHEGARLPGAAAGGCEPPRRVCSRARNSAKPRVHGKTELPFRPGLRAWPRPAILADVGCGKTGILLLFCGTNKSRYDSCHPLHGYNIPQPCYAPRAPTLRLMGSNTT